LTFGLFSLKISLTAKETPTPLAAHDNNVGIRIEMLVIRLARTGKKHQAYFRIVVADSKRAVTSKFIEILGNYDPHAKTISIDKERLALHLKNGAQPSNTVARLLQKVKPEPAKKEEKAPEAEAVVAETAEEVAPEPAEAKDEVAEEPKEEKAPEAEAVVAESAEEVAPEPAETQDEVAEEPKEEKAEEETK
jgi:small subunit ribosomal protein S16